MTKDLNYQYRNRWIRKFCTFTLRRVTIDDAAELYDVIDTNRKFLQQWLPWPDKIVDIESEKKAIKPLIQHEQENKGIIII